MPGRILQECTSNLIHRGPDGIGYFGLNLAGHEVRGSQVTKESLSLGLAHTRLAIFDLTKAGQQPMKLSNCWITYNGEIYNFIELRDELSRDGYLFETNTDTEILLAAYHKWGTDCVQRFNGMFSFAIYDSKKKGLFCCRDRLGIKPFYFSLDESSFCFASEPQVLHQFLNVKPRIRCDRLSRYLIWSQSDDSVETIFERISQLSGGQALWVDTVSLEFTIWQYWDLPDEDNGYKNNTKAVFDEFVHLFEDSVRLRLRSDVPLAITLSGGVDSSAIALAISRIDASPVCSYTTRFDHAPVIDETHFASEVSSHLGIDNRHVHFSHEKISELMENEPIFTRSQAEPYTNFGILLLWGVLQQIRSDGFKVVLSGQGGDELFLGYERYYAGFLASRLPNIFSFASELYNIALNSDSSVFKEIQSFLYFYFGRFRQFVLENEAQCIYCDAFFCDPEYHQNHISSDIKHLQRTEIREIQLNRLLRYDDRASSSLGMETRLPFLDHRLVEFAYKLGWEYKIRNGWTKYIVRKYLDKCLPKEIAWRRKKLGFNAPAFESIQEIMDRRWEKIKSNRFVIELLRDNVIFEKLPIKRKWQVYNIAQLADMFEWELV